VSKAARSRPGRVSSPAVRVSTPVTTSKEWTEPAIEEGRPSWEEHGGAPYGVLEDMQALGQPPNAKVKGRVKDVSLRKSLGKNAGIVLEAVNTPEGTPSYEIPRAASVPQEILPQEPLPIIPDDEKDVDYQPKAVKNLKSTRTRLSRSTAASSEPPKATASATPVQPQVKLSQTPSAEPAHRSSPAVAVTESDQPRGPHKIHGLDKIVAAAVERSIEMGQADLGAAINQVFLESYHSDRLTDLLRVILDRTATKEQGDQFRVEIRRAKKINKTQKKSQADPSQQTAAPAKISTSAPATRPEMAPRPSIEGPGNVPKIKLSVRAPKREVADDQPSMTNGEAKPVKKRSGSQSSSSSLSSLGDLPQQGNQMEVDEQRIAPPVINNLKRSSAEADLAHDERDKAVAAKKQKLREFSYQEPAPQQQATESHLRIEQPRTLRQKPVVNYQIPAAPAATTTARQPSSRTRRELSESPLSDLSPPPASPRGTPRNTGHGNVFSKKAKTKQS